MLFLIRYIKLILVKINALSSGILGVKDIKGGAIWISNEF